MLSKKDKADFYDSLYALVENEQINAVNIKEYKKYGPHIDIHAVYDCDEDEILIIVADVIQRFYPEMQFKEVNESGQISAGKLYTTGYWCLDFGVTVYFIRSGECAVAG